MENYTDQNSQAGFQEAKAEPEDQDFLNAWDLLTPPPDFYLPHNANNTQDFDTSRGCHPVEDIFDDLDMPSDLMDSNYVDEHNDQGECPDQSEQGDCPSNFANEADEMPDDAVGYNFEAEHADQAPLTSGRGHSQNPLGHRRPLQNNNAPDYNSFYANEMHKGMYLGLDQYATDEVKWRAYRRAVKTGYREHRKAQRAQGVWTKDKETWHEGRGENWVQGA